MNTERLLINIDKNLKDYLKRFMHHVFCKNYMEFIIKQALF